MQEQILEELKSEIKNRLVIESIPRIKQCLELLEEEEIWSRANENTNAIGNLVLHLCGNVRQYLISSIGGAADKRKRDNEFVKESRIEREELIHALDMLEMEILHMIPGITISELLRIRTVQGFEMNGIQIIIHVIEHFSYHTGQIAFYVKQLKNVDLKFYGDLDLSKTGNI